MQFGRKHHSSWRPCAEVPLFLDLGSKEEATSEGRSGGNLQKRHSEKERLGFFFGRWGEQEMEFSAHPFIPIPCFLLVVNRLAEDAFSSCPERD